MGAFDGFALVAAWVRQGRMDIETTEYATREEAMEAHKVAIADGVYVADVVDREDNIIAEYQRL